MPKPGDRCPKKCGGQLIVRTSKQVGDVQVRYLECNCCRCAGGKSCVPVRQIFARKNVTFMK